MANEHVVERVNHHRYTCCSCGASGSERWAIQHQFPTSSAASVAHNPGNGHPRRGIGVQISTDLAPAPRPGRLSFFRTESASDFPEVAGGRGA